VIYSTTFQRVSPHLNASYQWNGSTFSPATVNRRIGELPRSVNYAFGADVAANDRLTLAFDLSAAI
jgi:hypothetical protein